MDDYITLQEEIEQLTASLIKHSQTYYEKRLTAAKARKHLFVLLALKQNQPRYRSASLDRQLLFLLSENEDNKELFDIYSEMITAEEEYKGLEKLITAYQSKISALQSLMKWGRE